MSIYIYIISLKVIISLSQYTSSPRPHKSPDQMLGQRPFASGCFDMGLGQNFQNPKVDKLIGFDPPPYVCLSVCLPSCLPAFLPACLHACMHAWMYVKGRLQHPRVDGIARLAWLRSLSNKSSIHSFMLC